MAESRPSTNNVGKLPRTSRTIFKDNSKAKEKVCKEKKKASVPEKDIDTEEEDLDVDNKPVEK